eukprot:g33166.t1
MSNSREPRAPREAREPPPREPREAGRERDKDRRALKGVWICLYLYIGKFPAIRLLSIPTLRGSHSK